MEWIDGAIRGFIKGIQKEGATLVDVLVETGEGAVRGAAEGKVRGALFGSKNDDNNDDANGTDDV